MDEKRKWDDLDKEERGDIEQIGCAYMAIIALIIVAIIFAFKESWGGVVGCVLGALLLWVLLKFVHGDEWNV